MLTTALVSFREGVEAFLIVALTLAYLKQSGRLALTPAVYAGTAAGVAPFISTLMCCKGVSSRSNSST